MDASDGAVLQSTTTDSQGRYSFGPLTPGRYTVREVVDPFQALGLPAQPGSDIVLLNAGTTMVNFGDPSEGSIAGVVDQDPSYEGTDDTPLPGVTVFLDTNGNGVLDPGEPTAVSDAKGQYTFGDLLAGSYSLGVVPPSGLAPAPDRWSPWRPTRTRPASTCHGPAIDRRSPRGDTAGHLGPTRSAVPA